MAPLPKNNTAIYQVDYQANGRGHTVSFRYDDGGVPTAPDIAFLAGVTVILNAAANYMPTNLSYIEARYIPSGASVSIPAGLPLLLSAGIRSPNVGEAPAFLSVVGRSVGGRQARFFMLGQSFSPAEEGTYTSDYRITSSEDAGVAALVSALDISGVLAIDNDAPLWKVYMNLGYNAYWQKAVRP